MANLTLLGDVLRLLARHQGDTDRRECMRPAGGGPSMQLRPRRTVDASAPHLSAGRAPVPTMHDRQPSLSAKRAEPAGAALCSNRAQSDMACRHHISPPAKAGCIWPLCSTWRPGKIVGWAMHDRMRTEPPLAAMMMAAQRQRPAPRLICQSDRGSQYAAGACVEHLAAIGATPSMRRTGNCYDNARWRATSTPSRSSSSTNVDGRRMPKRGKRCSDTSKAGTTGTTCTRHSAISRPNKPSRAWRDTTACLPNPGEIRAAVPKLSLHGKIVAQAGIVGQFTPRLAEVSADQTVSPRC